MSRWATLDPGTAEAAFEERVGPKTDGCPPEGGRFWPDPTRVVRRRSSGPAGASAAQPVATRLSTIAVDRGAGWTSLSAAVTRSTQPVAASPWLPLGKFRSAPCRHTPPSALTQRHVGLRRRGGESVSSSSNFPKKVERPGSIKSGPSAGRREVGEPRLPGRVSWAPQYDKRWPDFYRGLRNYYGNGLGNRQVEGRWSRDRRRGWCESRAVAWAPGPPIRLALVSQSRY